LASSCNDVLEKIAALDPALVIMDVTQRGLDARKVCEATETPMVFISSLQLNEERRIRLKAATQHYLTKPYSRDRLVGGVRQLLRLH
jgi:DNA-binding response OmpR family regulator